jgi:hypothetical protein
MKYTVQMDSDATIYVYTRLRKIDSGTQKLMGDSQTHRQSGDLINLLLFLVNKESRLKGSTINVKCKT